MARFDINKTLLQTGDSIRQLSVLNPLTIRKKGSRAKAVFALALVCFFWGTTWLASKQGVKYMPALQLAGTRQFLAGLCYVIYFLYRREKWPSPKEWGTIVVLGFLNFFLSNGLTTWGVEYISAGLGAIIGAIFPLWLVVIGVFITSSKIPVKAILGLVVGFAGVCVIFYEHLHDFVNAGFRFGIFLSLAATWSWAFGSIYTKRYAGHFNPYFSLGLQMLISGSALLTVSSVTHKIMPVATIPWQSWIAIIYLVIFGSIIYFVAYLYALQNLTTEQTSLYAYINPIVAVLLGWLLFGERLTLFIAIGGMVTLAGVYLVNKAYKIPSITSKQ
jgi:drug/metabolite transporter (DMT)-like permease